MPKSNPFVDQVIRDLTRPTQRAKTIPKPQSKKDKMLSLSPLQQAKEVFDRQLLLATKEEQAGNKLKSIEMELAGLRNLLFEIIKIVERLTQKK